MTPPNPHSNKIAEIQRVIQTSPPVTTPVLKQRIKAMEQWRENPQLLQKTESCWEEGATEATCSLKSSCMWTKYENSYCNQIKVGKTCQVMANGALKNAGNLTSHPSSCWEVSSDQCANTTTCTQDPSIPITCKKDGYCSGTNYNCYSNSDKTACSSAPGCSWMSYCSEAPREYPSSYKSSCTKDNQPIDESVAPYGCGSLTGDSALCNEKTKCKEPYSGTTYKCAESTGYCSPKPEPTTPTTTTTTTASPAETYCQAECKAAGFCCNDWKTGSNQMLSCAQACMMRASGTETHKLATSSEGMCKRNGQSGCSLTENGVQYGMCSSCTDLTSDSKCSHGIGSTDSCDFGASLSPPGSPAAFAGYGGGFGGYGGDVVLQEIRRT
jgi:hypothetical protein